jgi:tetratricopeptide (TPR) repeat protein
MTVQAMLIQISLLSLLAVGVNAAAPDFRQLMHQGQEALVKSDTAAASKSFELACGQNFEAMPPDRRATCEHHLAMVDQAKGNFAAAEARLTRALAAWQEAGDGFQPSYIMSLLNLGELCRIQRRFAEAEAYLQRAVQLARLTRGDYPQEYPEALSRLAGVYAESDRPEVGRPLLLEAVSVFRQLTSRDLAEEARALDALGAIDLVTGRSGEAESLLREALNLSNSASGPDNPWTAAYQSDLALTYIQKGQYDRAAPLLRRARFVIESGPTIDNVRLGFVIAELSIVACVEKKFGIAEQYSREALSVLERAPGPTRGASLLARVSLGAAWLKEHRLAEAEQILPGAISEERRIAPGTCMLADGLRELAALRVAQHSGQEAASLYKEAIAIYRDRLGPNNPVLAPVLKEYANLLKHVPQA